MSNINNLINHFSIENLTLFFRNIIPSFSPDEVEINYLFKDDVYEKYESVLKIGEAEIDHDDLIIIASKTHEALTERTGKKRQYDIAKKILKEEMKDAAFFIFYDESGRFRFSFIKANYLGTRREFTDFKRFTYFVSPELTNRTFINQVGNCSFNSLEAIEEAFSVEPLNIQFYKDIAQSFYRLIGGKVKVGNTTHDFETTLVLPSTPIETHRKTYQEFGVRLIGRTIFCWFLKNKKSPEGIALVPESWLSSKAVKDAKHNNSNYYHQVLKKLFFLVLNKKIDERKDYDLPDGHKHIPFLNGGLFEAQHDDFFPTNSRGIHQTSYNLKIDNEWFNTLFETLEQYNFTIDENSIYDSEVSIDPEMLGTIFENLLAEIDPDTEKSARNATGSFYTPRPIVDYMVERSLVQYLKTKTQIEDEDRLMELFKEGGNNQFNKAETGIILNALNEVKILDPACGSGAFPMGALHKIIHALEKLDPDAEWWKELQLKNIPNVLARKMLQEKLEGKNADYIRKLGVLQNSIYGVDIQPVAIEISKLRSFLSLVIDETIDDNADNRGIQALPNLEFKFVTANTLIGLDEKKHDVFDFGETAKLQEDLISIRNQYLQAYGDEKEKLKIEFNQVQDRISKNELKSGAYNTRAQQLTEWYPFANESNKWFDPYWMFGVEKFDVVIGNPPYVDSETMVLRNPSFREVLKNKYSYASGNWDLFLVFIECGINLLKKDGIFNYIVPNKLITAAYANVARSNINTLGIIEIRDYSRINVFTSADVYPITILIKNNTAYKDISKFTIMQDLFTIKNCNKIYKKEITDEYWDKYFYQSDIFNLLVKLGKLNKISDLNFKINSAATVSEAYEIKKIIFDKKTQSNSFKFINTGTIDPYKSLWSKKNTQYIKSAYLYPRVREEDIKNISMNRYNQALSSKIIIAGMSNIIEAFIDLEGEYIAGKSTTIITGNLDDLIFLTALLNSKLCSFFVSKLYHSLKMSGGYLNINKKIIENIPIPTKQLIRLPKFFNLIIELIAVSKEEMDTSDLEHQIDIIVYKLYELTYEEVKLIDPEFSLSKEEYDNFKIA